MSPAMQSVLDDWSLPVWLTLAIALTALIYLRGWFALRKTRHEQFTGWRLLSFWPASPAFGPPSGRPSMPLPMCCSALTWSSTWC